MKKKNYWKIGVLTAAGLAVAGGLVWGGIELYNYLSTPAEETPAEETEQTPEEDKEVSTTAVMANYAAAIESACN